MRPFGTCAVLLIVGSAFRATAGAADGERPFAHPDRVRYDRQCMTIEGQDLFVFSGSFHYFRCPKELWRDRFAKIKEAGFNTVDTYVAWNVHEPQMPESPADFSKIARLADLDDWLKMAEEFGFYIIIRPGPYICAEWDRGGFPGWLVARRPQEIKRASWFRSDDPEFIAWSRHWYQAVCPVIAPHQITRKKPGEPGIILFQIENEYDFPTFPREAKANYLKVLAEAARQGGIDVPLFTCWSRQVRGSKDPGLRSIFDSFNCYPGWNLDMAQRDAKDVRRAQPDAPIMTAELQGGWFNGIGEEPTLRPDKDNYRADLTGAQINNLTLLVWQNGETVTNYYMLFGGTNFGDMAGQGMATCYDYNAAIRECGGVGEKFLRVKALGQMIAEHGPRLARSEAVDCESETGFKDVTAVQRRAADGSRYIFVRTGQHDEPRRGTIRLKERTDGGAEFVFDFELKPAGSKVLHLPAGVTDASLGDWWPKEQPAIKRPSSMPAPVKVESVSRHKDTSPNEWKPLAAGQSLNQAGVYDGRFVYYRATIRLSDDELEAGPLRLAVEYPAGDQVVAAVNGKLLVRAISSGQFDAGPVLRAGENEVLLLYENNGVPNGGTGMEKLAGVTDVRLTSVDRDQRLIDKWEMAVAGGSGDNPERLAEMAIDDELDWKSLDGKKLNANQLQPQQAAVYRAKIDVPDDDLKCGRTTVCVDHIDDEGWVFVNSKKIGETHQWDKSYRFDATEALTPGENRIAIVVKNGEGPGGLAPIGVGMASVPSVGEIGVLSFWDGIVDRAVQWSKVDASAEGWTEEDLPAKAGQSDAMLTWHRLTFELPATESNVWAPWLVRLQANGNGFVYLNGRPLGRFWQAGKQRDFYLPECWLNFGPGRKNVVTLCLRPVDKPPAVQSAEVMPYAVYAETR